MSAFFKVLFLSVLQGVAEFLPVSSSGHLVAAKHFLGVSNPGISLELALHAGTLVSVCVFYFAALRDLAAGAFQRRRGAWMYLAAIALSMVPCGFAYALLGDWLEEAFEGVRFVGPALMATGVLLLTTRREPASGQGTRPEEDGDRLPRIPLATAFWMGLGQMVAMLPGVSRSGTTIWVARLCRVPSATAARFSFLMSVPVIGGACLMKLAKAVLDGPAADAVTAAPEAALPAWMLVAGAAVSAAVGYASLRLLVQTLDRGRFWVFGAYCLLAGLCLVLFA